MTTFNVYLYREIRLTFEGIEAHSHAAALSIARDGHISDADDVEDGGNDLAAVIDVAGEEDVSQSVTIDFEAEQHRKAARKLLAALKGTLFALDENTDGSGPSKQTAIAEGQDAIAQAEAAGIPSEPAAPGLLAALNAVLPYAWNMDVIETETTNRERNLTMTTIEHTPGPWDYDMDYIVAPDPNGRFPDIYIAEIAHSDDEGRIASPEQQDANRHLIAAAPALLASLRAVLAYAENEGRTLAECGKRDGEPKADAEATACDQAVAAAHDAIILATGNGPPWRITDASTGSQPYSVLLLYPDYANDGGTETYYTWVEARDPLEAVALAQRKALATNEWTDIEPDDFAPLLVTQGHHHGEPLSNK